MPWEGYNYEDAILISERLVYEDVYSSIHIERYDIEIRETKYGMETITRNIPELNENELEHLDSKGVAKLGSWIKEGDILVGRISPFDKKTQTTYQKLLYAILDKSSQEAFRDSSLRAPKGIKAKVVNIKIYKEKSSYQKVVLPPTLGCVLRTARSEGASLAVGRREVSLTTRYAHSSNKSSSVFKSQKTAFFNIGQAIIGSRSKKKAYITDRLLSLSSTSTAKIAKIGGRAVRAKHSSHSPKISLRRGRAVSTGSNPKLKVETTRVESINEKAFSKAPQRKALKNNKAVSTKLPGHSKLIKTASKKESKAVKPKNNKAVSTKLPGHSKLIKTASKKESKAAVLRSPKNNKAVSTKLIAKVNTGKKVPKKTFDFIGEKKITIKKVSVYLAEKRKIQVGDKMAGRHGNKGIVSLILPRQDMPFL